MAREKEIPVHRMSGGLFPGRPFRFNLKCVLFSLFLALGYWFAPHKNKWILAFLVWFPYIALAWYDYSYNCQDKIQPTVVPFGRYMWLPFKPQGYKDEYEKLDPETKQVMKDVDHIAGWTIVTALLAWYFIKKNAR